MDLALFKKGNLIKKILAIFLFFFILSIFYILFPINLLAQSVYLNNSFYEIDFIFNKIFFYNYFYLNYFFYFNNLNNLYILKNYNFKNNIISFNLIYDLKANSDNEKESEIRRAEILFFISIPFIYIYFRELMRLNNYLTFGDFDREWDNNQKMLMYITFIIFGFDVVYNDLKKNKK